MSMSNIARLNAVMPPPVLAPSSADLAAVGIVLSLEPGAVNRFNKRQWSKAMTRAKLIAAARHLFTTVGYFDTGIRDLADHMGMSTGAVFATVEDKPTIWRLAFGGPPPSGLLAEEAALLLAIRPGWSWLLKCEGTTFTASLHSRDYNPVRQTGQVFVATAASPARALRAVRLDADAADARASQ